jgi:hypothetical protein
LQTSSRRNACRLADLGLEMDNMATFLGLAVKHRRKIGFKGTLLREPKPQEPTKHQVGRVEGEGGLLAWVVVRRMDAG